MNKVDIKIISSKGAVVPCYKTEGAAGADVCALVEEKMVLKPGERTVVPTGLFFEIPQGYEIQVRPRSGLALKKGLRPANCVGAIDEDYRGEVMIALHNDSAYTHIIEPKERIAQLIVMPYMSVNCYLVSELNETERDDGGFGSTGSK